VSYNFPCAWGEVPERLNGTVSKTVVVLVATVGSNPTLSADQQENAATAPASWIESGAKSEEQLPTKVVRLAGRAPWAAPARLMFLPSHAGCPFLGAFAPPGVALPKLFVDMSIEIHAPAYRVWDALTRPHLTDHWASEFSGGGPRFHIESDWGLGSPVIWKDPNGQVILEGNVTALDQHKLLRFTVFDVRVEGSAATPEDGITYKLTERNGRTRLWVSQGDFSALSEGEKYRDLTARVWDRVLLKVKHLAEEPASKT
jgi:uncharacterized protein YndB with AHSA1/START domain